MSPVSPSHDPRPANRLVGETSPYLLQHAHNPVDWYPWGPEAFARARELDRPVFLSIGYAACHWCHVMERESFEDEATAALLNARFVAIKVDREERPDVDAVYMRAVQALSGNGGWPMSVFLDTVGRPFFGGTYFPDRPRHGMPAFTQVLGALASAWDERRADLADVAGRLVEAIATGLPRGDVSGDPAAPPDAAVSDVAEDAVAAAFDAEHGGWGTAPKFPQAMTVLWLLRRHHATGSARALAIACRTLDAMAAGGIHDQLGGGFHRYSTDARWLVPHFEQMLYDNALLARAYTQAWQVTGDAHYRDVATGVLAFLVRDLRTPGGGFAASLDADTEGEEGATFTWTATEIRDALGGAAPLFCSAYGVTDGGNWEGRTILSRVQGDHDLSERYGIPAAEVAERLAVARARLLDVRAARPQPARDDKVLAAWNGLAIGALAEAGRALVASGDAQQAASGAGFISAAAAAAADVTTGLLGADGMLGRSWKDGRATADGVLEDYANLADGLLSLYEATGDERWFATATTLCAQIHARFTDPGGGFFDTAADGEALVIRPKDQQDNAVPSGGAMAATALLRLAAFTGEARHNEAALRAIHEVSPYLGQHATAFAQWLCAVEAARAGYDEVAIVGEDGPARMSLEVVAGRGFRPFAVTAVTGDPAGTAVPLLGGRFALHGRATAFVCRGFACRQPVHEPEALDALLAGS